MSFQRGPLRKAPVTHPTTGLVATSSNSEQPFASEAVNLGRASTEVSRSSFVTQNQQDLEGQFLQVDQDILTVSWRAPDRAPLAGQASMHSTGMTLLKHPGVTARASPLTKIAWMPIGLEPIGKQCLANVFTETGDSSDPMPHGLLSQTLLTAVALRRSDQQTLAQVFIHLAMFTCL